MSHEFDTVLDARVGILMGSPSDWPIMQETSRTLTKFDIAHESNAISAHRQPRRLDGYVQSAEQRGVTIFICAAGGAAHLAGVVASLTSLPVLACPMPGWALDGLDSLLSMVQMPKGVPVATFAVGKPGAINAALFAVSVLGLADEGIQAKLAAFRAEQSEAMTRLTGV